MASQKPSIPKGTRDFGPVQMLNRNYLLETIKKTITKFGFLPLETPSFENLSVLTGKYGDEGDMLLFKILNSGDFLSKTTDTDYKQGYLTILPKIAKKGLRYDLTVPFARFVAMNRSSITFPFKRYQVQPVWRADRPQKSRYQEFYQFDVDVIGTDSLLCEAEIIGMVDEVFRALKLGSYQLKMSNRKVLEGMAETIGQKEKAADMFVAIDKLDKVGMQAVQKELSEKGFPATAIDKLTEILSITGSNEEKITHLQNIFSASEKGRQGVQELADAIRIAKGYGYSLANLELDLTLARGLSYYTGAIFEVKLPDAGVGSVSGGGRYDNLTGVFGLPDVSGVGISFGVDRIYDALEALELFPEDKTAATQVLFVQFDDASLQYCLPLATLLRQEGINVEIYPEPAKMKKQLSYADSKNIPFVVLAGENEMANGNVALKDMVSGQQMELSIQEVISRLRGL